MTVPPSRSTNRLAGRFASSIWVWTKSHFSHVYGWKVSKEFTKSFFEKINNKTTNIHGSLNCIH